MTDHDEYNTRNTDTPTDAFFRIGYAVLGQMYGHERESHMEFEYHKAKLRAEKESKEKPAND